MAEAVGLDVKTIQRAEAGQVAFSTICAFASGLGELTIDTPYGPMNIKKSVKGTRNKGGRGSSNGGKPEKLAAAPEKPDKPSKSGHRMYEVKAGDTPRSAFRKGGRR
jgi:hypothetical protein